MEESLLDLDSLLKRKIEEFETFLVELNLNHSVKICMYLNGYLSQTYLIFGPSLVFSQPNLRDFKLWVREGCADGTTHTLVRLCHADRDIRIRAVRYFSKLYEDLVKSADMEKERLRTAIGVVDSTLDTLRQVT